MVDLIKLFFWYKIAFGIRLFFEAQRENRQPREFICECINCFLSGHIRNDDALKVLKWLPFYRGQCFFDKKIENFRCGNNDRKEVLFHALLIIQVTFLYHQDIQKTPRSDQARHRDRERKWRLRWKCPSQYFLCTFFYQEYLCHIL